jgi:hypothetical protein
VPLGPNLPFHPAIYPCQCFVGFFPFLGSRLCLHSGPQQLSEPRIPVTAHRDTQHSCFLFSHVIATTILYLGYGDGFAADHFLSQSPQYLPLPKRLARKCSQDDTTGISAASVQPICITEQRPTLFERVNSTFQQIVWCHSGWHFRNPKQAGLAGSRSQVQTNKQYAHLYIRITLTTRPQPFGGRRWFFICPRTSENAMKLHLPSGAYTFASRKAYRLGYRSQRETPRDRSLSRAFALPQEAFIAALKMDR